MKQSTFLAVEKRVRRVFGDSHPDIYKGQSGVTHQSGWHYRLPQGGEIYFGHSLSEFDVIIEVIEDQLFREARLHIPDVSKLADVKGGRR